MNQQHLLTTYGTWAVITGASSGIGRAIAENLAQARFHCVLVGRSADELERLARSFKSKHGVECRVVAVDLAHDTGLEVLQEATADLDVGLLVASAGFGTSGDFLNNPLEPELEMLNVNCRSLLAMSWNFGRRFAQRGKGGIILLSSIVSFQGTPWSAHYAATKAYVQVLAEGLRTEFKTKRVEVLAVAPGPTNTGFASRAKMKMGAALDPQKIAPKILQALGRRTTVLPGFLSKLLVYSLAPLPRWARIAIMGRVMRGMTS